MYNIIKHLHSINRWVILALLLISVLTAFSKWISKKEYTAQDKKLALFNLISSHIQLILGIILLLITERLFFTEGWRESPINKYFVFAHLPAMILGIIFITIGYSISKRKTKSKDKFMFTWIFFLIGLLSILGGIPWGIHGAGWY
jgi:low temperature requirement protein LtrA